MKKIYLLLITVIISLPNIYAQSTQSNNVQTALGFLTIPTDARSAGMGDMGVGTTPDLYSHQYNPSKYLFGKSDASIMASYSPWMRKLVNDMSLSTIAGHYRLDSLQSLSASFRYFAMGDMKFSDDNAAPMGEKTAYQLSFDAAYARKLSQYIGGSISFRYALSDFYPSTSGYKKGWGLAADLNVYYQRDVTIGNMPSIVTAGTSITNIGTKVSFHNDQPSYFMPMMFKLGTSVTSQLDNQNSLMLGGEIGRSLVPTRADKVDNSAIGGMFSSIGEGNFRSIAWALGAEYAYRKILFARTGYFHESKQFGQRQYLTFGAGLVYKIIHFDFAYLVPTGERYNGLANTVRLSLAVDIAK